MNRVLLAAVCVAAVQGFEGKQPSRVKVMTSSDGYCHAAVSVCVHGGEATISHGGICYRAVASAEEDGISVSFGELAMRELIATRPALATLLLQNIALQKASVSVHCEIVE